LAVTAGIPGLLVTTPVFEPEADELFDDPDEVVLASEFPVGPAVTVTGRYPKSEASVRVVESTKEVLVPSKLSVSVTVHTADVVPVSWQA